jgi:sulfate adenylyltransferase
MSRLVPPHGGDQLRPLLLSGTLLRDLLSAGKPVPREFAAPEVLDVLKPYYAGLEQAADAHGRRL